MGFRGIDRDITERKQAESARQFAEEQFRLLLNSAAEGIYGIDNAGVCKFANRACKKILGYGEDEELVGRNMHDLIHHSGENGTPCTLQGCKIHLASQTGGCAHAEDEVFWRKDGSSIPVEYWSHPIYQDGKTIGSVVTFFDITDRKQTEKEKQKLLHDMGERVKELQCMFDIIKAIHDAQTLEELMSEAVCIMPPGWHYPEYTKARIVLDGKEFIESEFMPQAWKQTADLVVGETCRGSVEVYYLEQFPELDEGPFLSHERNLINNIASLLGEAVGRIETEMKIAHMATHDPLTGLYNRLELDKKITGEINRAARYGRNVAVLLLDIDYFKHVNDTYGHKAGDIVLQELAKLLESAIRKIDFVARYGGEEFVIVLPETNLSCAGELAERLRTTIAQYSFIINSDRQLQITTSIGISCFPSHGHTEDELLQAADSALYSAKDTGRNRVKVAPLSRE